MDGAKLNVIMKRANIKFTYHDYVQLPDDKRYELLEGEFFLVPAPNLDHQRILRKLGTVLSTYVEREHLGEVFYAPCDVLLSDINVVQPDIIFVARDRMAILTEANIQGPPDLLIEILSPSTRKRDLGIKRSLYAKYGVREYWIVDPENKTVSVLSWTETGYRIKAVAPQAGPLSSGLFPDLNLDLTGIF